MNIMYRNAHKVHRRLDIEPKVECFLFFLSSAVAVVVVTIFAAVLPLVVDGDDDIDSDDDSDKDGDHDDDMCATVVQIEFLL